MAKDRKVVYTLAVESDPAAKKVFDEHIAGHKAVSAAARESAKAVNEARKANASSFGGNRSSAVNAAVTGARGVKDSERAINRELDAALRERAAIFEREKKMRADRIRDNVGASRASRVAATQTTSQNYQNRAAAQEQAAADAIRARATAERDAGRAAVTAARESERANARALQNNQRLTSGLKQTLSGLVSVGRAAVLFGVSGEENIEKAVRALARFEAVASAVTGTINLIEGIAKTWRAVAASTAAATAAQAAYNATSRGGAAAAAAGGAGSAIGGGLAGGAAVSFGGRMLAGGLARVPHVAAAAIGFGGGVYAGRAMLGGGTRGGFDRDFGRLTDWTGLTDNAGDEVRATQARRKAIGDRASASRRRLEEYYGDGGERSSFAAQQRIASATDRKGLDAGAQVARAEFEKVRRRSGELNSRINTGAEGVDYANAFREKELLHGQEATLARELIDLTKQRMAVAEEAGQRNLARAKAETSELRQQLQVEKSKRDAALESIRGTTRSIGAASAGEVARLNAIADRVNRKERLSVQDGRELEKFGITEPGNKANEERGAEFLKNNPALNQLLETMKANASKQYQEISVKVATAVSGELKLSVDNEKNLENYKKVLIDLGEKERAAIKEIVDARFRDQEQQKGLQDGTAGG